MRDIAPGASSGWVDGSAVALEQRATGSGTAIEAPTCCRSTLSPDGTKITPM